MNSWDIKEGHTYSAIGTTGRNLRRYVVRIERRRRVPDRVHWQGINVSGQRGVIQVTNLPVFAERMIADLNDSPIPLDETPEIPGQLRHLQELAARRTEETVNKNREIAALTRELAAANRELVSIKEKLAKYVNAEKAAEAKRRAILKRQKKSGIFNNMVIELSEVVTSE